MNVVTPPFDSKKKNFMFTAHFYSRLFIWVLMPSDWLTTFIMLFKVSVLLRLQPICLSGQSVQVSRSPVWLSRLSVYSSIDSLNDLISFPDSPSNCPNWLHNYLDYLHYRFRCKDNSTYPFHCIKYLCRYPNYLCNYLVCHVWLSTKPFWLLKLVCQSTLNVFLITKVINRAA